MGILASSAIYAQTPAAPSAESSVTPGVSGLPVLNKEPVLQCPATCLQAAQAPAPKPVAKKKVVRKAAPKKVVAAKPVTVKPANAAVVGLDVFHIPAETSMKDHDTWAKPLDYSEVEVKFDKVMPKEKQEYYKQTHQFNLHVYNKRTGEHLDVNSLKPLENLGSTFALMRVTPELKEVVEKHVDYKDPMQKVGFDEFKANRKSCEILMFTYQLKDQPMNKTETLFIDKEQNLHKEMPANCKTKVEDYSRETTYYTESGNIINIGLDQDTISKQKMMAFNMHFTKSGRDFFGHNTRALAFNEEFTNVNFLTITPDKRGPYFGSKVDGKVPVGNYSVLVGVDNEAKTDWIKFKSEIK